ncbi:Uncharacterised protein [uncultured archaeon]|nr:Uncharacterised protein [uncultured archaeon]
MAPISFKAEVGIVEQKFLALLDLKHIILVMALVAAGLTATYLWQDRQVKIAEGKQAVAEAVAKQAADDAKKSAADNTLLQQQKDIVIAQLQASNDTLAKANQSLKDAIQAESFALANQQAKTKTLPPTEQAALWQTLVPSAVVAPTTTGFTINQQGGVDTLVNLEELPVDRTKIAQLSTALANDEQTIKNDAGILQAEKDKHTSDVANDGKQLIAAQDETKKVQAEFTTYKHKARKNVIKAFVVGYVAGLVTHKFLGI